jgi:hypothetical protein
MAQTETQAAAPEMNGDSSSGATIENQEATQETTEQTSETTAAENAEPATPEEPEEISYHAVEKEGHVAAIWEMQGRKHLRTIDPRSGEGKNILSLFTSDHHEDEAAA